MNKIRDLNNLSNEFVTKDNYTQVAKNIGNILLRVFEVITLDDSAVINSGVIDNKTRQNFGLERFPEKSSYIDELKLIIEEAKIPNFGSGNFFGQMHPSRNIASITSGLVSSVLNQNLIAEEVSPAFTQMENKTIGFLSDLIGYDINKSGGSIVSGGTTANHTAMLVARNIVLGNDGDGVVENGIFDSLRKYNKLNDTSYESIVVFIGEDNHYSLDKLVSYVGIGSKNIKRIPYKNDGSYELDLDGFKEMIDESEDRKELIMGVFITAGTTEKGHVHDIDGIINISKNYGQNGRELYTHVDAAHGGGFLVNDGLKETLFKGINQADSVTIDGHKMLYTNYSCGGIVFKDKNNLNVVKHSAKYIMSEESLNENHGMYTIEGSRGTSGVHQLYSTISSLGKEGFNNLVNINLENTKYFYERLLKDKNFEVLSGEPSLNLICFRVVPKGSNLNEKQLNEFNKLLRSKLLEDGEFYLGDTEIDGKNCFKTVFMNPETSSENIDNFFLRLEEMINNFNF